MDVDTSTSIGSVTLPNPVMTAAGTSGHGAELGDIGPLDALGAVVVKSLAAFSWPGNPPPRLHPVSQGMLNAVGLQGPGIEEWQVTHLGDLVRHRARVVISIWGRSPQEYELAARQVAHLCESSTDATCIKAVEINLSCPNIEGHGIIAHDSTVSAEVIRRCSIIDRPLWAKLSPNTDRIVECAEAVNRAGAEAVTLINTVAGLALDETSGMSVLGSGSSGGLSGRVIHPVAVRIVHEVSRALPELAIVGVGGVSSAWEALELILAGARAVQIGTATFADPRTPFRIARELPELIASRGFSNVSDLVGLAHRGGFTLQ